MELVETRPVAQARAEQLLCAVLAGLSGLAIVALAPPGGDTAAHLYRTELVRDGVWVWDSLWFGGHYPLVSYSLLYYLPAALVGNVALVLAATVVSGALFAAVARAEWGDAARWPARLFAVLAAGPLFTGTYSYGVALAFALGTLRLLQLGRPRLAAVCTVLTLAVSPLGFAFLAIALAAVALARRRIEVAVVAGVAGAVALQLAALALFPSEGRYPFGTLSLVAATATAGLGAALAQRSAKGRTLALFLVLWALVCAVAYVVPSPFGDNLTRLRALVLPLVLAAAVLARFRPRWLAAGALGVALLYNLGPDVSAVPKRIDDRRTSQESFWAPALDFLRARGDAQHRVEVVPTFGHWEAWFVPDAGFALARGWYRQIDLAESPELYRDPLSPAEYRDWLRRHAVRYVLLPRARLGPLGADREAELLRSGRAGLAPVFRHRDWTIYEVAGAAPILAGGTVDRLEHDRISGRVPAPGEYPLRLRWTPYLTAAFGDVCLRRAADGSTLLVARAAGAFTLSVGRPAGDCRA
jgi:hypothetical protein